MFWRMTGLSASSPVDAILDKDSYTLDDLLDEDDIIQECKALNTRLINFLREKTQVEQLLRLIVEEVPEDAEKKRVFKFPFIACEIFTCEVDIILRTLVEDEGLMNLLFSFLKPDRSHSPLLAGYFSKVVICLMLRKTLPLINYVQKHPEIVSQLVDLIGITSIMEVLIRLIGADETMYANYADAMQWLDDANVLEMIVDKFSSSDSPEVHANAAEVLCAITRYAPPALASKICSPGFVGRLFHHAFEPSRPRSVLVHSLSVCISLLDPKRLVSSSYQAFRSQLSHGTLVTASPETVNGMLESLGDLLKLLDISSDEVPLPTTFGTLKPPLGKHRLKIVEFISVLLSIGSEAAEAKLVNLGAIKRDIDLFFEYPYNNFLHHFVENIITSCLESKQVLLIEHLLNDCDLVGRILEIEKNPTLSTDTSKPTIPSEGRAPPKVGNGGHITRIANKLIQLANSNPTIQSHLQDNNNWVEWQKDVLAKRNAVENVYQWACGRPTSLQDRGRDSDEEDFRDRDYDVAALASNLSQAFRYGIYTDNDIDEQAQVSAERDEEDVYFDDESAEVLISSLRLGGENQDSGSLFTNSNWFAFEDNTTVADSSTSTISPTPDSEDLTEEKFMIGESTERTTEPNPNHSSEASPEGDEEEDDDDGPTIVLGNGPVEPSSVSESDKLEFVDLPMDEPSPVGANAGETEKDVLPIKNENDDVGIVEKEVIMEAPVTETGMADPTKEMDTLVAETEIAETVKEMETPVAETVVPEVKNEMDIPVAEIGATELKAVESENVQK
ncbi:Serine/threonine-protein phosphatase 6 regulatory subunit 1 [Rhynchospora pubera]|uniref:Serine/threonine-protein phosphatase 6 regulatory subunit 1 n=1 Tax=Rhynchospora pubera TaxID=906938 RepID=A0AAV8CHZ2_9POAL|nr:Serine/threonine-protein phosphatase 6 regulatory subunit 1 [Rhynchospora pubera]